MQHPAGRHGGRTLHHQAHALCSFRGTLAGAGDRVITFSLQSGSNGNAIYVEAGGVRLLFDAGISGIQAQQRLAQHGRDIREVDALLISHDHSDHVRAARGLSTQVRPAYLHDRQDPSRTLVQPRAGV